MEVGPRVGSGGDSGGVGRTGDDVWGTMTLFVMLSVIMGVVVGVGERSAANLLLSVLAFASVTLCLELAALWVRLVVELASEVGGVKVCLADGVLKPSESTVAAFL